MTGWQTALSIFTALTLTLAIEALFTAIVKKPPRDIFLTVLANIMTNPLVNAVYLLCAVGYGLNGAAVIAALEVFAVAAEAALYRFCSRDIRLPLVFSLCSNALSFSAGLIFNAIF